MSVEALSRMTPESIDRLRALLTEERQLELRLIKIGAEIQELKGRYAAETRTYGLSNEAILLRLTHKD